MVPVIEFFGLTAIATSSPTLLFTLFLMAVFSLFLFPGGLAWAVVKPKSREAIPGPSGLPFAGILPVFWGPRPHVALAQLARNFNAKPLMAFSIGLTRFVVSSDPDTAKEILSSPAFADRPIKDAAHELLFHRAIGFAPYGDYWRNLRRIAATHLFTPSRIDTCEAFRVDSALTMVNEVKLQMERNGEVSIRRVLHRGSLSNIMITVFGQKFDNGGVLEELVKEGYQLLGMFNYGDHFPFLKPFDLHGVKRRSRRLAEKVHVFVSQIIEEHKGRTGSGHVTDFVDVLLSLQEHDKLASSDMVAILWEMVFRGTDTVAVLLEWAIARMVTHPDVQDKVQREISSVVGTRREVSGADTAKMGYLHAVVKETLRLHPPGPLLSWARLATRDVSVGEKHVPAGTTAMVNMWSITHDDRFWERPEEFDPDRFVTRDVSVMGSDLRLAPFGSGRRVCPGKPLALASVHLWLAQLLRSFKWVQNGEGVDFTEKLNLSMEMETPLVCRALSTND